MLRDEVTQVHDEVFDRSARGQLRLLTRGTRPEVLRDHRRRVEQARRWAELAVKLDRSAIKARAAVLAARYRESQQPDGISDVGPLIELVDLSRDHPDTPYLRTLISTACRGQPWLRIVPAPTEAIAQAAVQDSHPGAASRRNYL